MTPARKMDRLIWKNGVRMPSGNTWSAPSGPCREVLLNKRSGLDWCDAVVDVGDKDTQVWYKDFQKGIVR